MFFFCFFLFFFSSCFVWFLFLFFVCLNLHLFSNFYDDILVHVLSIPRTYSDYVCNLLVLFLFLMILHTDSRIVMLNTKGNLCYVWHFDWVIQIKINKLTIQKLTIYRKWRYRKMMKKKDDENNKRRHPWIIYTTRKENEQLVHVE